MLTKTLSMVAVLALLTGIVDARGVQSNHKKVEKKTLKSQKQRNHKNRHNHSDSTNENAVQTKAYFGDKVNDLIVVVDVENMKVLDKVATGHEVTYAAEAIRTKVSDKNGVEKFYIDNRGSNAIDVLDAKTNTITKTIALAFYPRSIDINKHTGYVVVSGKNKTMASVIDTATDTVLCTVGENILTTSCGHPKWLNKNHFVLLDREHNQLLTYKMTKHKGKFTARLLNTVKTLSPVHNIIPPEVHGQHGKKHGQKTSTIFFATEEGSSSVYGAVLKLEFLESVGLTILYRLAIHPQNDTFSPKDTGVHHHNFLANQKNIYVGSKEGTLAIVDYSQSPMKIVKTVSAGKGAGHTVEFPKKHIAVVINHTDKFITLMDTVSHQKIADIQVSNIPEDEVGVVQTQSHPEYHFSKDGKYFYLFLTEEGALVKVDLENKRVVERLDIGGHLSMGSFIK